MKGTIETRYPEAWTIEVHHDDQTSETLDWQGNFEVDGELVAVLQHRTPGGPISFYRYRLDEDAIESFESIPEDDYSFFLRCCAAFDAATR